jgi:hypothetical protein
MSQLDVDSYERELKRHILDHERELQRQMLEQERRMMNSATQNMLSNGSNGMSFGKLFGGKK